MSNHTIKEVKVACEVEQFLKLPSCIYKNDPNWIHPLDDDINKVFDKEKNKMFEGGELVRYIVLDEKGECVGRIAAFYNLKTSKVKDSHGEINVGGCGFFESIESKEVAHLLFDTAIEWLKSKGMEAVDGPINFGDRESWWGLLTEGYIAPAYGMNYNPSYYQELFESYGFQNYFNGISYRRELERGNLSEAVIRKAKRLNANCDYSFKHIKKSDLNRVALDFCKIYRSAWSKFEGIAQITEENAIKMVENMKPILDEKLLYFAYYKGEAIGFFISIPDLNQIIKGFNGKFGLINKLKFLYKLKFNKKNIPAIGLVFGVMSEHQGKGVESGMIHAMLDEVEKGNIKYSTLELVWIGDFNPLMMRMVENYIGATKAKCHTTYRYLFDKNRPFERAPKVSISRKKS